MGDVSQASERAALAMGRSGLPFSYDEFERWYKPYALETLDPARLAAAAALNSLLDEALSEKDRAQVRVVGTGRTKGPRHTWNKMIREKYEGRVQQVEDTVKVIDDLVGLRITCNNLVDQQRVQEIVRRLPQRKSLKKTETIARQQGSEIDYVTHTKESGYRAIHTNLLVWAGTGSKRTQVVCELQIRTVLQDAWGELTHEDTYLAGSIPPIVGPLSRRIADLLAVLDDLAEDLRTELERWEESNEARPADDPSIEAAALRFEDDASLAMNWLRSFVEGLRTPTDLASIAWQIRREFGTDVVQGWFGYGSFKSFLRAALPDVEISAVGPSFVVPTRRTEVQQELALADPLETDPGADSNGLVPESLMFLRTVDKAFPSLDKARFANLFATLEEVISRDVGLSRGDHRWVNEVTRLSRDRCKDDKEAIGRGAFDYVMKSLLHSSSIDAFDTPGSAAKIFAENTVLRLKSFNYDVSDSEVARVRRFLAA